MRDILETLDPIQRQNLTIRANLVSSIVAGLKARALSQTKAAEILGVSQPRVSELMQGKVGKFRIDSLVDFATILDIDVELKTKLPHPSFIENIVVDDVIRKRGKAMLRRAKIAADTEASEALEGYAPLAQSSGIAYKLQQQWITGDIDSEERIKLLKKHYGIK